VLQEVALGTKSLADYTHLAGRGLVDEIRELAEKLQGKRVLHVSATAFGGGVSEILYTLVPLMRDVGLEAHWQVIMGREEFFNATKLLHNSLQGDPNTLTPNQWELFDHYNKMNADSLEGEWDVIIVHDPQPIGMRHNAGDHAKNWVWRCHIDLSEPNPEPIGRLLPLIKWQSTDNGNVTVLNDTADYYRFFDATPHAEFLYECVARTIDTDLPAEAKYLESYDTFKRSVMEIVDMPDNTVDLLFRFLRQNKGALSKRAREKEFAKLTDKEVSEIEANYNDAFN